jgi:hypothetical protein
MGSLTGLLPDYINANSIFPILFLHNYGFFDNPPKFILEEVYAWL